MGKVHAFYKSLFHGYLVLISQCQFCPALMERETRSVHFVMEASAELFKTQLFSTEKVQKKHSQADKISKLKYLLQKDQKLDKDVAEILVMLSTLLDGLESSLHYDQTRIEKLAAKTNLTKKFFRPYMKRALQACCPKTWRLNLQGSRLLGIMSGADFCI